ncbi:MAG: Uma2 family endonuclease [Chloroflexi bacterium]|nr:Uma2 family endonuclease [Chloroflexota bacterium]
MSTRLRWTTTDLELFPDPLDDTRYEIIDGELYVSKQPRVEHQYTCNEVAGELRAWSRVTGDGVTLPAPGLIFADDDNVAPDVIWASTERIGRILGPDRKLHGAPELVVEVLSPGDANVRRDREAKLLLYSRRRVDEYWIVDPLARLVDVYRRESQEGMLHHVATLGPEDTLQSPLLPGFSVRVDQLFFPTHLQ